MMLEHASGAEVAAYGLGDALADGRAFVPEGLLQLRHGLLCVLFCVTYVVLEAVQGLALLLDEVVQVLEDLMNVSYT